MYVILLVHKGYIIHVSLFALAARKPAARFYTQLLSISQPQHLQVYLTSTCYTGQVDFHLIAARVLLWGFPGGSDGKESTYHGGDLCLIPGWGQSPGEGNGYPLQYSCLENPWTEEPGGLQSRVLLQDSGFLGDKYTNKIILAFCVSSKALRSEREISLLSASECTCPLRPPQ